MKNVYIVEIRMHCDDTWKTMDRLVFTEDTNACKAVKNIAGFFKKTFRKKYPDYEIKAVYNSDLNLDFSLMCTITVGGDPIAEIHVFEVACFDACDKPGSVRVYLKGVRDGP